jgi:hypothetical protein
MMILYCPLCGKEYRTEDEHDLHNEGVCIEREVL